MKLNSIAAGAGRHRASTALIRRLRAAAQPHSLGRWFTALLGFASPCFSTPAQR